MGQTRTPEGAAPGVLGETHQPLPGLDPGLDVGPTLDDATTVSLATGSPSALSPDLIAAAAAAAAELDLARTEAVDQELDEALGSVNEAIDTLGLFRATVCGDAIRLLERKGFSDDELRQHNIVVHGLDDRARLPLTPEACCVEMNFSCTPYVQGQLAPAIAALRGLGRGCRIDVADASVDEIDHSVGRTSIHVVIPLRVLFDRQSYVGQGSTPSGGPDSSEPSGVLSAPSHGDAPLSAAPAAHTRHTTAGSVRAALAAGVGC